VAAKYKGGGNEADRAEQCPQVKLVAKSPVVFYGPLEITLRLIEGQNHFPISRQRPAPALIVQRLMPDFCGYHIARSETTSFRDRPHEQIFFSEMVRPNRGLDNEVEVVSTPAGFVKDAFHCSGNGLERTADGETANIRARKKDRE